MAGAVLNALNIRLDAPALAFILDHSETKVLITDREFAGVIRPALAQLDRPVLVIGERGTGKALLAHLAKIAAASGAIRIDWNVLDWNRPSIEFYESLGAKPQEGGLYYRLDGEALKKLGT